MKIKRENDTQLILDYAPWFMSLVMVFMVVAAVGMGLVFVGVGIDSGMAIFTIMGVVAPLFSIGLVIIVMRVFVKRVQVIFDRDAGTITFQTRTMRGYSEVVHDLANLEHAVLKQSRDSEGRTLSKAVIVLSGGMSAGEHPLTNVATNGNGPRNAVNAINRWIDNGKG